MDMPHTMAIHDATRIPFSIARPTMTNPMVISPSSTNNVVLTDTPVTIWKSNSSIPQCCMGAMPCRASRKFTQTNSNGCNETPSSDDSDYGSDPTPPNPSGRDEQCRQRDNWASDSPYGDLPE